MALVGGGVLGMLVGVGLLIAGKKRKAGFIVLAVGATLLCIGVLRVWYV